MSQMMPQETTQGFAPPSVRQFSVFLENKVGRLLELVSIFDEAADLHLASISVLESSDHAVVRMIANNAGLAERVLKEHGIPFATLELLVVELESEHSMTTLCVSLLAAELNIRFAYPLLLGSGVERPTIALAVDDHVLAGQILRRKCFRLLGEADLI